MTELNIESFGVIKNSAPFPSMLVIYNNEYVNLMENCLHLWEGRLVTE